MKIKKVQMQGFKRFTDLTVGEIPKTAKLILLVGPNGSGKTSFFEALHTWYKLKIFTFPGGIDYIVKKGAETEGPNWYNGLVNVEFYGQQTGKNNDFRHNKFYLRTAYRNEPDFTTPQLKKQTDPTQQSRLAALIQDDKTVSDNYQRLVSQTLSRVFDSKNDEMKIIQLRNELIGEVNTSMQRIFDDLTLSSLGNPLINGSFYFEKGTAKDFHYKNLSAGEKSAFDLILDMIMKSSYFEDAVYCIDEPEAHMHTRLQAKLLKELYNLTPQNSQLWISTHSIGMLKAADELDRRNPGSVIFLDFDNKDFDAPESIAPTKIDNTIWNKFLDLAFADFSNLIVPATIVFCEGTEKGRICKNFDAQVYSSIFAKSHYDTKFISAGSCTEIANVENHPMNIISTLLGSSTIIKFIDRDDRSENEIRELASKKIKTSKRRHIECYLLDDEVIKKLCTSVGRPELLSNCISAKQTALQNSIDRGNAGDDVKSASGEIVNALKRILSLTQCGSNTVAFLKDTMAPLVTEDTEVYKELEKEIFG
jgi:predicted ATP-dependent endonuclease of OLD family